MRWVVALSLIACALFPALVLIRNGEESPHRIFLVQLGSPRPDAPLVRRPAPGVAVRLERSGFRVAAPEATVSLTGIGQRSGEWKRFDAGVARLTRFGRETILVAPDKTEQFLTVDRRQGPKTWRWRLDSLGLHPRVGADGAVGFLSGRRLLDMHVEPVAVLADDGREVTPKDLRWTLGRDRAGWLLELRLDDSDLPLPYVIDPAITHRASQTSNNGAGGATSITLNMPGGVADRDLLFMHVAARGGNSMTIATPSGWTLLRNTNSAGVIRLATFYRIASSEPASYAVTFGGTTPTQEAVGAITAYYGAKSSLGVPGILDVNGATSAGNNATPQATSINTLTANALVVAAYSHGIGNSTQGSAMFTQAAGMTERYDAQSANGTAANRASLAADDMTQVAIGATGNMPVTASASGRWVAHQASFDVDNVSPTATQNDPGANLKGTVTIDGSASDADSSVANVQFQRSPAGAGTWTNIGAADPSSPYSVSFDTTGVGDGLYDLRAVATDVAGNVVNSALVTNRRVDNTNPTGSVTSPAGGANVRQTISVDSNSADAGGSGVASAQFQRSPAGGGSWTNIGAADTSSPYSVSFDTTAVSDGLYDLRVVTTDNAGNSLTSAVVANVRVDNSNPSALHTFPAAATAYGAGAWNGGCASAGFCGTHSDGGSGVQQVEVSIRRVSTGLYWASGSFSAGAETFASTSLAGSNWSYAFGAASFPADGDYTVHVRATDNAGNVEPGPSRTFTFDDSPPSQPSLSFGSFTNSSSTGSTVYYRPSAAGGFTVTASASDSHSGVSGYSFPTLPAGWTPSGSGASKTYSYSADPTEPGASQNVTATNGANLTSTPTSFAVTADSTGPTGQTLDLVGGTYFTTTSVAFTTGDGSDSQSGLDTATRLVRRAEASLTNDVCGSFGSFGGSYTSPDNSVSSGNCYRYEFTISDKVGNVSAPVTVTAKVDTSAPNAPGLSYGSLSNVVLNAGVLHYRPSAGSGQFAVTASSSDAESGIGSYGFPAAAAGWSRNVAGATATYSHSGAPSDPAEPNGVTAQNNAGLTSGATSFTVDPDSTPPSTSIQCDGAACSGSWYAADVSVSLSASDAGSGLNEIRYTTDGSDPSPINGIVYSAPFAVSATTTVRFRAYDRLGNEEPVGQQLIQIDQSAPVTTAAAASPSGSVYWNGSGTVFYRPGSSGSFDLTATVTDGQSGPQKANFPAIAGFGPGGDDTSQPYSSSYTYSGTPGEPGAKTVTGYNNANQSSPATVTITADGTAPGGMSATVAGGYYTALSISVTLDNGSDGGSGLDLASAIVERDEEALAADSCPAFDDAWSAVTLSGGADTSVQSGKCYRYRLKISDRVGNQGVSGASAAAKVDTSAPSAPGLVFGSFSSASATGSTVYYRPSAGSGQFTVTASSSDAESGIASYGFPAGASGWSVSGSGASRTYSHSGSPSDPGEPNDVTATNNAGLSGSTSFTVTPDGAAPTGMSATVAGGYYTALSVAVTLDDGSDAGSGVDPASGLVERDEESLAGGSCASFDGSWSAVALSGGADTSVQSGKCYRYRYSISDRVGNQGVSGPSATAKVDTSAPGATSLSYGSLQNAAVTGSTVYYRPSAATGQFAVTASSSDAESGIASYGFATAASGWTRNVAGGTATYSHSGSPSDPAEPNDVTAQNNAGLDSTATSFTVTPDATDPASAIQCDGGACASWYENPVSVTLSASDTASGLAEIRYTTDGSDPTSTTGTVYASAFNVSVTTEIRFRGFDRVGNAEPVRSQLIEFDTTGPTGPALTVTETPADPDQHVSGSTLYYRPGGGRDGSFTVEAATSDPESGIERVSFPAIAGMTGGGDDFASPYANLYSWSSGFSASGAQTVTARNNVGMQASASFTVTPDSTQPNGQSVNLVGGPYYPALSIPLTLDSGSDVGSGLDASSGIVERESATLSNGNCTSWSGGWTAVTLVGGADTSVLTNRCYRYRFEISDNVGNQSGFSVSSADAKVDATVPVTSDDAPGGWSTTAITVTLSVTESGSGVASTQYKVDGGSFQSGTSIPIPAPADHSNDGVHTIDYRSTDVAGNVESLRSATVRIDTTLPVTTDDAPAAWRSAAATVTLTPNDALSGIASTQYRVDGGSFQSGTSIPIPAPADHSNDGVHTIDYRSTDVAGNVEPLNSATVRIDTTLPSGSVSGPAGGAHVNGVVPISAAAADVPSGVTSVEFLVRPAGAGSFSPISTDTSAPYVANWDSTGAGEGSADLKVVVLDAAANSVTSAIVTVVVDNPPAPTLADPGTNLSGVIDLEAASAADTAQVVFERSLAGAGSWTTVAADTTPPYNASFDTQTVADERYDFRVVATDAAGFSGTSPLRTSRVDNTAPTVSMSDPGSGAVVGGPNVHVGALASDLGSGIASVRFEARPAGAPSYNEIATDTSAPFDAAWNATGLSGSYELRAVATDAAGNPQASVALLVTVDPTAPSVTLDNPGSGLRGVVTLSASTQSAAVARVVFKRKPSGGDSWSEIETDTGGPWNASFDTRNVPDGLYDLRAQAADAYGTILATHTREQIRVDNTAPAIVSTSPAGGSSVESATNLVLVVSEPVAAVRTPVFDGAAIAPEISDSRVTFATGSLAQGDHELTGTVEDGVGNASAFRLRFTVKVTAQATLILSVGKASSSKRGKQQIFVVPIKLSAAAKVQTTLLSPTGRRLRTSQTNLPAGRHVIRMAIPRASVPPGRYTILVRATSADGTQIVRRVHVVIKRAKPARKHKVVSAKALAPVVDGPAEPPGAQPSSERPAAEQPDRPQAPAPDGEGRKRPSATDVEVKPLKAASAFVGGKHRRSVGLVLILGSLGAATGLLVMIELQRALSPRKFTGA